ncbi:MAG: hypothetical protein BSOLF_0268 [Candidatus Carbobacillus altaicus]|uniref:Uncharacterized protein n=1 Tax=Candidatus Carbonibacillus altaicus TaxID=2163959 RepID=A0A2R6Y119_9BACL|nr:MAG: hypothetical protein BSOLF_0268 [Candidatus Carbobacillus altaicus]
MNVDVLNRNPSSCPDVAVARFYPSFITHVALTLFEAFLPLLRRASIHKILNACL